MKRIIWTDICILAMVCCLCSCGQRGDTPTTESGSQVETNEEGTALQRMEEINLTTVDASSDSHYNVYEIFPYSFCDSDGDGIGDLNGITSKLDYIRELGADSIWMTPIFAANSYHKYDQVDYYAIDSDFGTMEDFEQLMTECEKREIAVILDLVVNHSSSLHPWFREAYQYLQSLGDAEPNVADCPYIEYYNFTKDYQSGYSEVSGTDWYYEAQFYYEQPDLNLDSETVREEIKGIVEFWLDKGIAGFRLDATTYLYSGNDEKNLEFLTWLNDVVKAKNPDAYLVGEAWTNLVKYSQYYQSGVDSFFDFDFGTKDGYIVKTLQGGSASSLGALIVDAQKQIRENQSEAIDAVFLTNHDTARLVSAFPGETCEPLTKLAHGIGMMMGGNYYLYYGEELGLKGSGDDENKRSPMLWSSNESAEGMCASIAKKEFEVKFGSLEEQEENGNSIYHYIRQGLLLRQAHPGIARGTNTVVEALSTDKVLVMRKEYEDTQLLWIVNISGEDQAVDLTEMELSGKEAGEMELVGLLLTGEDQTQFEGGKLTVPAYGIVLLK